MVSPAASVLGSDGVDAGLGESTAEPGEHQLGVDGLQGVLVYWGWGNMGGDY